MSARILVVDDLEANIKLLEAKLHNQYYQVFTARNGLEALEMLKKEAIDIILLDVMMPQMNGFETCARIKANPKTAAIPVIMVTALNSVDDLVNGLNAGADDFITKPIVDIALFARIRSLVRVKALIDEIQGQGEAGIKFIANKNDASLIESAQILLVDDDISQINFIKHSLRGAKINIANLNNIAESLNENLDLAIVSTQLASLDGLRICANILNNPKTRNLPIIILVEADAFEILAKALDFGVSDDIAIPLNKQEIKARVRTQLRRKKYQDALKNNLIDNLSFANIDSLTGLYNRHYFNSQAEVILSDSLKTQEALSLIMLDLDFFKAVNDTYGHLAGDEVLKQTAQRLKRSIRSTDILARFGGEEFILLLAGTTIDEAGFIAERMRKSIENEAYSSEDTNLSSTASFGISSLKPLDTIEALINRADKALYIAKDQGRNRVVKADS